MIGISSPFEFDFISPPSRTSLIKALERLYALGALNNTGNLTDHGRKLANFPLDPIYGHLLLKSREFNCIFEILTIVAMLSAENIMFQPQSGDQKASAKSAHRTFFAYEGDLFTLLNIYDAWRQANMGQQWCYSHYINFRSMTHAHDIRTQLTSLVENIGFDPTSSCGNEKNEILKCFVSGLFLNTAMRIPGIGYQTMVTKRDVSIHPSSVLFARNPPPKCVVFTELVLTSKAYIRGVNVIDGTLLPDLVPSFFGKIEKEDDKKNISKVSIEVSNISNTLVNFILLFYFLLL